MGGCLNVGTINSNLRCYGAVVQPFEYEYLFHHETTRMQVDLLDSCVELENCGLE